MISSFVTAVESGEIVIILVLLEITVFPIPAPTSFMPFVNESVLAHVTEPACTVTVALRAADDTHVCTLAKSAEVTSVDVLHAAHRCELTMHKNADSTSRFVII